MPWEPMQTAIEQALAAAAQVEQVRLPDARRAFDRAQRLHVEYELEAVGDESVIDLDDEDAGGLVSAVVQNLLITARIHALSQSHSPDVSAIELALRLIVRAYLPEVTAILEAAGLALVGVDRAVPGPAPKIDDRHISAMSLGWRLQVRVCEEEEPVPRPYFDRVEVEDEDGPRPPRAIAEDLVPEAVLDAASWRTLWLGTQTDLVAGDAWADSDDLAHNQDPGAPIGSDVLTSASAFSAGAASTVCSDRDAFVLRDGLAIALLVRGPAPAARARVLSRLAPGGGSGGGSGWALDALPDGSLELQAPGTALVPLSLAGVLDGSAWTLVVLAQVAGVLSLRSASGVASASAPVTYADEPATLGASEGTDAPAGLELALVGEAETENPAALLAALAEVLGL